jgi:hypothetical protein
MTTTKLIATVGSTRYYAMRSAAKMPSSVLAPYAHSAVVRTEDNSPAPRQIKDTNTASVRWDSGPGFCGKTDRCAANRDWARAIKECHERAANLRARLAREADEAYEASLAARSGEEV